MPALELVFKKLVSLAINGNAPAIRLVIEISQNLDREIAAQAAAHEAVQAADANVSDMDLARWIAFVAAKHQKNKKRKKAAAFRGPTKFN